MIARLADGPAHVVVFEDYRGRNRVPLLERKTGSPINPEGRDLWVLCPDEESARVVERYGQQGINEYVTAGRRPTFEALLPRLPDDAAVVFSTRPGDDDAFMRGEHPLPKGMSARYAWRDGTYHLEAETAERGRCVTRTTRIGRGELPPEEFRAKAQAAARRLLSRAPAPFDDVGDGLHVCEAASRLLERATAPAAAAVRWWLRALDEGSERAVLPLSASSFRDVDGVTELRLERVPGSSRIRSRIRHGDGSVLTDLGLRLAVGVPDTIAKGAVGMPADALVDGDLIDAWTITEAEVVDGGTHIGFRMPGRPFEAPAGLPPLSQAEGAARLAQVLERDLYELPALAPLLEARGEERPARVQGSQTAAHLLGALPDEDAAHIVAEAMALTEDVRMDLGAWMGRGVTLERTIDRIEIGSPGMGPLCRSPLMPAGHARRGAPEERAA